MRGGKRGGKGTRGEEEGTGREGREGKGGGDKGNGREGKGVRLTVPEALTGL